MGDDGIKICFYEDWMFDQVIDMIVTQYGRDREEEAAAFRAFYDAPFQRPHGIRLVALDGERVCGFQAYSYWPYHYQGQRLRSFQLGGALVAPADRGRRIFARLLSHPAEPPDGLPIDFLFSFPPFRVSFGSITRGGFGHTLNLSWLVRPLRPFSVILGHHPEPSDWRFDAVPDPVETAIPAGRFALSTDSDLVDWRESYRAKGPYYGYLHHRRAGKTIRFALKSNRRGRINELIVGDIVRDSEAPELIESGLQALVKAVRGHRFLGMLSVALNESADFGLKRALLRRGFFPIKRKIAFVVKPLGKIDGVLDPARWQLYRSDVDSW